MSRSERLGRADKHGWVKAAGKAIKGALSIEFASDAGKINWGGMVITAVLGLGYMATDRSLLISAQKGDFRLEITPPSTELSTVFLLAGLLTVVCIVMVAVVAKFFEPIDDDTQV